MGQGMSSAPHSHPRRDVLTLSSDGRDQKYVRGRAFLASAGGKGKRARGAEAEARARAGANDVSRARNGRWNAELLKTDAMRRMLASPAVTLERSGESAEREGRGQEGREEGGRGRRERKEGGPRTLLHSKRTTSLTSRAGLRGARLDSA